MADTIHVPVADASQVGEARRITSRVAQEAGLNEQRAGEATIIATELANNLLRYGGTGGDVCGSCAILLRPLNGGAGPGLEILAVDRGAGMRDVTACMRDGYSTGGTPGNGLGAVQRLSAEFDLFSLPGRGTVVMSRVRQERVSSVTKCTRWGAVTRCAPGENVCGDTWRVVQRENVLTILLADGLGHGPGAAEAAAAVAEAFATDTFASPAVTLALAHRRAASTRGAAAAVAQLDFDKRLLRYCGVGNISGTLWTPRDSRGLFTHNGTVGHQAPKIKEFEYPLPETADENAGAGGMLIMHSDGLQSRWDLNDYPGLHGRHPGVVAAVLARDFLRGRDDVTVLAVRLRS